MNSLFLPPFEKQPNERFITDDFSNGSKGEPGNQYEKHDETGSDNLHSVPPARSASESATDSPRRCPMMISWMAVINISKTRKVNDL